MDVYLAIGATAFLILGVVAYVSPDHLWRLYRIEPRWRREHTEKPPDWPARARRQGYYFIGMSVAAFLFGLAIGSPGA
ncbi:MAG: hypothetical protein OXG02_02190 [Chloroflexi bacterium]|nr:hypothetical protein [Chloroflexota bacterium]